MTSPPAGREALAREDARPPQSSRARIAVALLAYAALIALHTKVTWGMWAWRDLTSGDTAYYFANAWRGYAHGANAITFSPLYTMFYGAFFLVSQDAFVVTIAHRLVASLLASILVLAVARTVLSWPIAWLVAAWWAVLPINYDTLYEVHLFSVVPVLAVYLLLFARNSRRARGIGLGIMMALPVLLRNELLLAGLVMVGVYGWWEYRALARGEPNWTAKVLRAYGIPLVACALVIAATYSRSDVKFPVLPQAFRDKQTLNMCHVYAFAYKQRHPEWDRSSWLECEELMQATFGTRRPTMGEAIRANPLAMAEHLAWNATLIPNGLQLLLFNRMWGDVSPDYIPSPGGVGWVLPASLALVLLSGAGWWRLWRDPAAWDRVVTQHASGWVAALAVCVVGLVIMLTQRPRPSYLLGTSSVVMLAVGIAAEMLARRWTAAHERAMLAGIVVVALLVTPIEPAAASEFDRPLLQAYRRLQVVSDRFIGPARGLVALGHGTNLCLYFAVGDERPCQGLHYHNLRPQVAAGQPWGEVLHAHGATAFYADEAIVADPIMSEFLEHPEREGWRIVIPGRSERGRWFFLERAGAASSAVP
jgi:hypothetical protein